MRKTYPIHKIKPDAKQIEFRIEEIAFNNHYNVNAPHAHDYYELFLFKTGGGKHSIDFISTEIEAFSVHLVLPGQIHHIGRKGSCTGLVMVFSKDYLSSNTSLLDTINAFPFNRHQETPYIKTIGQETFHYFFDTVAKIFADNANDGFNSKAIIQSYLNILLLKTQELFADQKLTTSTPVQLLLGYIDRCYSNTLKGEEIANALNTTLSALNKLTKKETGKNIKDLIKEKLLIEVKKSLLLNKDSVKSIAYNFSFSDPSNFNKFFKRNVGCTPLEFKRNAGF